MSERFKYAKNGICRVENFAEHLAAGTFPRIELGRLCGMEWYSEIKTDEADKKIYPLISYDNPEVEHSVQIYLKLENHSEVNKKNFKKIEKEILNFDKTSRGFDVPILEILELNNGWLKNGALSFEYGIQVEAIYEDNIWTFNFNDKLFNAGPLYAHKLLLSFHSTNLGAFLELKGTDEHNHSLFIDLLQIWHGVRFDLRMKYQKRVILEDAVNLKMFTVISYIDWYLAQTRPWQRFKGNEPRWIRFAIQYNLRHFLAFMLKSMTSLKGFVSEEDVEKMSNESMKMFMAKFLYEKF